MDKVMKCRYPDEVCGNMIFRSNDVWCDSVPCGLRDELPPQTNFDKLRQRSIEDVAHERIEKSYNPNGADSYIGDFGAVDIKYVRGAEQPESYAEAFRREIEWLNAPTD